MATRARILGDDEPDDAGSSAGQRARRARACLRARPDRRAVAASTAHRDALVAAGASVREPELTCPLDGRSTSGLPTVSRSRRSPASRKEPRSRREPPIPTGEILLGYPTRTTGCRRARSGTASISATTARTWCSASSQQHVDRFWGCVAHGARELDPDAAAAALTRAARRQARRSLEERRAARR